MKSRRKKEKNLSPTTSGKSAAQEKTRSKSGYIEIFIGIIALLAGIWLFSQTWGITLLSVDSWIGRISRYYAAAFIMAGICFAAGIWTIKHAGRLSVKNVAADDATVKSMYKKEERICPACGKVNDAENVFCQFCGSIIGEFEEKVL